MRKITAGLFITLDGVIEAPEKWNPPYYNDEMTQVVMGQMADADTQLYGRRSYELFRTVFTSPSAPPHAEMMTNAPKIVVSTTLEHPDWGPTLISSGVAAGLTKLKQQPGKNISTGRHRQAPVRGSHQPGAAQAPRIQATEQRRPRLPVSAGH